jgi:hypothetical protein
MSRDDLVAGLAGTSTGRGHVKGHSIRHGYICRLLPNPGIRKRLP